MSATIALALASMVGAGIGDLIYKQAARAGLPAHRFLMVQTWAFFPTVVLYGLLTRSLALNAVALWGCLAGLFAFTAFYNFAWSLQSGRVSINAPLFRLSFVITAVLAIVFLGEPLTLRKGAGIACALIAVWLLVAAAPAAATRVERRAVLVSLGRAAVATAALGVGNFLYKIGLGAGATPSSLLAGQASVVSSLALTMVRLTDGRIHVPPGGWRHAPSAGIVLALAFIAMMEGLARGQASVVVPIAQMGFVVTALVGVVVMREPFGLRMLLGLVAAATAIFLLAGG